jgi:hypothetical protein
LPRSTDGRDGRRRVFEVVGVAPFVPVSGSKVTDPVLLVVTLSAVMSATGVTAISSVLLAVAPTVSRTV